MLLGVSRGNSEEAHRRYVDKISHLTMYPWRNRCGGYVQPGTYSPNRDRIRLSFSLWKVLRCTEPSEQLHELLSVLCVYKNWTVVYSVYSVYISVDSYQKSVPHQSMARFAMWWVNTHSLILSGGRIFCSTAIEARELCPSWCKHEYENRKTSRDNIKTRITNDDNNSNDRITIIIHWSHNYYDKYMT